MSPVDPVKAREFAANTVRQLRDAGFEALWAGGCVRDMLMQREPKDYDVATNAHPEQIREVFGYRRTLAIGANFGVIALIGPRGAGQIDVATFRRDAQYTDGRHPDSVTFCSAAEDAQRRDFTINGLFFDPISKQVIDYVGGQADLAKSIVRAIGDAAARFQEDKLRIVRAVRFAATLGFEIDPATLQAVRDFAPQIRAVSAERITEEMRRILEHPNRRRGLELLRAGRLLPEILPQSGGVFHLAEDQVDAPAWQTTLHISERLPTQNFAAALAVVLREILRQRDSDWSIIEEIARAWRLSNDDAQAVRFCLQQESLLRTAPDSYWPSLQRVLIDARIEIGLAFAQAVAEVLDGSTAAIDFCRERLAWPPEQLNPKPLIGGNDLYALRIPKGPVYKELLHAAREAQLVGELRTQNEALDWVRKQWAARSGA